MRKIATGNVLNKDSLGWEERVRLVVLFLSQLYCWGRERIGGRVHFLLKLSWKSLGMPRLRGFAVEIFLSSLHFVVLFREKSQKCQEDRMELEAPSNVWCSLLTRMSCCEKRLGKLELSEDSCLISLSKLSLSRFQAEMRGRFWWGREREGREYLTWLNQTRLSRWIEKETLFVELWIGLVWIDLTN